MTKPRLEQLAELAESQILALDGVYDSGRSSYRIGKKVFIRVDTTTDAITYGFKLTREDAAVACSKKKYVVPMTFGGMGAKGWVELRLSRKSQLSTLVRLLRDSRALF